MSTMAARWAFGLALATLMVAGGGASQSSPSPQRQPTSVDRANPTAVAIARGVAFLRVEVPRWKKEHPCYSCHNNGDATRALLEAGARGYDIGDSLDDTLNFLKKPAAWDQNKAPSGFDDKRLARVQFASALAVADRVYVLDRGRVVHEGPAATLRDDAAKRVELVGV